MALLGGGVGDNFGEYSNSFNDAEYYSASHLTDVQIANLVGLALYQFLEESIS